MKLASISINPFPPERIYTIKGNHSHSGMAGTFLKIAVIAAAFFAIPYAASTPGIVVPALIITGAVMTVALLLISSCFRRSMQPNQHYRDLSSRQTVPLYSQPDRPVPHAQSPSVQGQHVGVGKGHFTTSEDTERHVAVGGGHGHGFPAHQENISVKFRVSQTPPALPRRNFPSPEMGRHVVPGGGHMSASRETWQSSPIFPAPTRTPQDPVANRHVAAGGGHAVYPENVIPHPEQPPQNDAERPQGRHTVVGGGHSRPN